VKDCLVELSARQQGHLDLDLVAGDWSATPLNCFVHSITHRIAMQRKVFSRSGVARALPEKYPERLA
jgi:hypothetical protein